MGLLINWGKYSTILVIDKIADLNDTTFLASSYPADCIINTLNNYCQILTRQFGIIN